VAASSARASASGAAPLLSIGQVLARLTPQFPDLTPSKLRFLEEQGLVSPARTDSGYRKFCTADLERLRLILSMQRDHYLPLKVIRAYLDDLDAGRNPTMPGGATPGLSMLSTVRRLTREELLREAGASPALLHDAVSSSIIVPAEPRHLRGFRGAAERELGLIESALVPQARRKDASSRAQASEMAVEIAGQLEVVRSSLIRSALVRLTK